MKRLEVHEHRIISGPRSNRTGNWPAGMGSGFAHSHEGGDVPHEHPDTGPASFRLGKKKLTARPNGEQCPLVKTEPKTFDVFVLDSALVIDGHGGLRPIAPDDEIGLPLQADHMERKFGLRAVVHDLRALAHPPADSAGAGETTKGPRAAPLTPTPKAEESERPMAGQPAAEKDRPMAGKDGET